ncbi:hypothetical protein [Paenilisteria newyorkensis]|uniref:hypothetical protein n=1 Tax=Listeria newyorkensis TaxID=1497681 RepID=UPI00235909EA|nr:hypothetical protein [Listeria newyorkensis]WAO22021.1 hypothetical protein OTR81_01620 [Listeria newyorkensis]
MTEKETKQTPAQIAAKKKWNEKNREKNRLYRDKSAAKNFILKMADKDNLEELRALIDERLAELEESE